MRIQEIVVHVVEGPRKPGLGGAYRTALGASPHSEHAIVEVLTDQGITGIGEASSVFARRGRLLGREIADVLAPALIGLDPRRIAHLVARMDKVLDGSEPAKAALEMALYDIVGRALGTPVYNLLGGLVRERIPLSWSIPWGPPEAMAEVAAAKAAEGFRTVKVKVGRDPEDDVLAVRRVREAVGPLHRVRVDANMAWRTAKEAIAIVQAMQRYAPELIEQPLPPRELDAMAEIRRAIAIPLMADESVWTPRDAMEVVRRQAADIVNVYVSEAGGLLNAWRIFAICEQAGLPCMIGSMPEFGIGTAAQIHLGVAMTNLGPDCDTCGVLYHAEDCLTAPLRIESGFAYPPDGPGLGIALDPAVVARWRIADPVHVRA
jgi:L-alanine-DL-glutamate epimerase-like enolase superfamily enzyme